MSGWWRNQENVRDITFGQTVAGIAVIPVIALIIAGLVIALFQPTLGGAPPLTLRKEGLRAPSNALNRA